MATFQLSQALNPVNNPSGVFSYGFNNIDDPNFPLGFNLMDSYGYASGNPTPLSPPYDQNEVLGWYKSGNPDPYMAIAYQHLGLPADPIHFQITPQPFPVGGIYIHPTGYTPFSSGRKSPLIRVTVPYNSTFSLNGTIQRATNACGSDVGYSVIKNISTPLIARTVLPTSNTPSPVILAPVVLNAGDIVDFIIDRGDDGTDSCDDTALDFTVTFIGLQVSQPILQGTPTCTSTSLTYNFLLQQDGNVSLYKVGNLTPIQTIPIVMNGVDGTATFTGLNLTSGGTYYAIATNVGQLDSNPSTNLVLLPCATAIAVDDSVTTTSNTAITFNVLTNDTLCP